MRVLLDEHLPIDLAHSMPEHDVSTVRAEGWNGVKNGELLRLAADTGFELLVTNDASIEYQQNLVGLAIAVLVLDAPSNKIEDLAPLMPAASEATTRAERGELFILLANSPHEPISQREQR